MGKLISRDDLAGAAECLRVVLAETDAGKIPVELDHVAYLRGAMDMLSMLSEGPSRNQGIGIRAARHDR